MTRRIQFLGEAHNASGRGRLWDVRQVRTFYAGRGLAEEAHIPGPLPDLPPSYNVTTNGEVAAIVAGCGGQRRLELLRWGLIPARVDDPGIGSRMINALSETAAEKHSFHKAFKEGRCLVLADGVLPLKVRRKVRVC